MTKFFAERRTVGATSLFHIISFIVRDVSQPTDDRLCQQQA